MVKEFTPPKTTQANSSNSASILRMEVSATSVIIDLDVRCEEDLNASNFKLVISATRTLVASSADEFKARRSGCKGQVTFTSTSDLFGVSSIALEIESEDEEGDDLHWSRVDLNLRDAKLVLNLTIDAHLPDAKVTKTKCKNPKCLVCTGGRRELKSVNLESLDTRGVALSSASNLESGEEGQEPTKLVWNDGVDLMLTELKIRPCSNALMRLAASWLARTVASSGTNTDIDSTIVPPDPKEKEIWLSALVGWCDEEGNTPLHWAAKEGKLDIAKFLIESAQGPQLLGTKNRNDALPKELAGKDKEKFFVLPSEGDQIPAEKKVKATKGDTSEPVSEKKGDTSEPVLPEEATPSEKKVEDSEKKEDSSEKKEEDSRGPVSLEEALARSTTQRVPESETVPETPSQPQIVV